jgi:hypothetical protein
MTILSWKECFDKDEILILQNRHCGQPTYSIPTEMFLKDIMDVKYFDDKYVFGTLKNNTQFFYNREYGICEIDSLEYLRNTMPQHVVEQVFD